jgi:alkylation response protein AidB-like acyl-CoA dehydrogenase
MHFDLLDEQKQFEDGVERLLNSTIDLPAMTKGAEVIAPLRDRLQQKLAELGAPAVLVSEQHGGLGMGLLTLAVLADCFGRYAAPTNVLQSALAAWLISVGGDQDLRDRWLEPLITGRAQAAFALAEGPDAWAPEQWRARRSDPAVLKTPVEGAENCQLIIAGLADGFVALDAAEVKVASGGRRPLDMTRPTSEIRFAPPAGRALGAGPELSQRVFDALLVLHAADAAGAGRRAYQMAVEYAKVREQFGRPIGSFQGLKHQLANMAVDIEPTRFLGWYAAHAWDQIPADASRAAALAKAHAGDVAVKTARAAVEAHGGIGYTWEYPLHLLLKRAMHDRMVLGSSASLRERVAALTPGMVV